MVETERVVIEEIINGDTRKFNDLVSEHIDIVFSVIYSYLKHKETSEDLTQETFIKAYKSISNFKFKSSFKTWIVRIAINTVKDYFRKKAASKNITLVEFPDIPDTRDNPLKIMENTEFKKFLDDTVFNMPDKLKTVYLLREQEKYTYEDIGAVIKKPIGTVESRLFNARKYIQQKFIEWAGL